MAERAQLVGVFGVLLAQLLEAGVTPLMPPTEMAPGLFMIFLRDPDGRTIELAQFSGGATCTVEYARAGNGVASG